MFRSVLTKLYSKYSNKYSISAQHMVMPIYRNNARLQEQKEYAGLPLTLRIQDILYKNVERERKKVNERDRPKEDRFWASLHVKHCKDDWNFTTWVYYMLIL